MEAPSFVDDAGSTWFAPASGGLFYLENGTIQRVSVPGLNNDVMYSISGGDGELWLGRQQGGLTELTLTSDRWAARTFTLAKTDWHKTAYLPSSERETAQCGPVL